MATALNCGAKKTEEIILRVIKNPSGMKGFLSK
jgi:hypothetical protein